MTVWDNQQVTRSWFAGILEGEGNFTLEQDKHAVVNIDNTDTDIIGACEIFLKGNDIWYALYKQPRAPRKVLYSVRISSRKTEVFQYAHLLYKLLLPSLECRLDEYQQILGTSETLRSSSIDLDWLAGIYEAEGCFDLKVSSMGPVALKIQISNTNPRILAKVTANLDTIFCGYHQRSIKKAKEHHTQATSIEIVGMKRCRRFLDAMSGRWVSRRNKKRTSLMSRFIDLRFSHSPKDPYTPDELQIIQAMADLNRR